MELEPTSTPTEHKFGFIPIKISPFTETDMNKPKQELARRLELQQANTSTSEDQEDGYIRIKIQPNIEAAVKDQDESLNKCKTLKEGFGFVQTSTSKEQGTDCVPTKISPNMQDQDQIDSKTIMEGFGFVQPSTPTKEETGAMPIKISPNIEPAMKKQDQLQNKPKTRPRPVSLRNQITQTEGSAPLPIGLANHKAGMIPSSMSLAISKVEVLWFFFYVLGKLSGTLNDIIPRNMRVRYDLNIQRPMPEASKKSQLKIVRWTGFLLGKPLTMVLGSLKSLILAVPIVLMFIGIWAFLYEEPWIRMECALKELTKERQVPESWWFF